MTLSIPFGQIRIAGQSRWPTAGLFRFQRVGFLLAVLGFSASLAAAEPAKRVFNIEAQPATQSLIDYARQAHTQLGYDVAIVDAILTNPVVGEYDPVEALALLLEGTGLTAEYGERGIFIRRVATREVGGGIEGRAPAVAETNGLQFAQLLAAEAQNQTSRRTEIDSGKDEKKRHLEEIIVTGTNIRGAYPSASPILMFDRSAIDASGYVTLNQFIQTIPQVFGGGPNENGAASTAPVGQGSPTEGTGINLRGLGTDATLTLINGHRIGTSGDGRFVDISSIPTSAIERIEVLTDGASAIYGSDAIAGVVNIILRDEYEGIESRVTGSTTSDGAHRRASIANTFGTNWNEGGVLLSYEYYRQSELDSNNREFVEAAPDPQFLLPWLDRHSLFVSARQWLSDSIQISGQGYFNHRDVETATARVFPLRRNADAQQFGGVGAMDIALPAEWRLSLSGAFSESHDQSITTREDGSISQVLDSISNVTSADALADGKLLELPGGAIKAALGGQFRRESINPLSTDSPLDRNTYAAFAEIVIPLFGEGNAVAGVQSLEFSAAGRFEHYSDFGDTTNGKVGLAWEPSRDVKVRGTYSTSFRAPRLVELQVQEGGTNSFIFPAFDFVIGDVVPVFFVVNNSNPDLNPETASTWTIGADFALEKRPSFQASVTYFNIDYKNRIESPCPDLLSCLRPEFAPIVPRDPDPSLLQSVVDTTDYIDFGTPLAEARAFVDATLRNISSLEVSGLDFSLQYVLERTRAGRYIFSVNGTYLSSYDKAISGTAPISMLNTTYHPADLKLRGQVGWGNDWLTAAAFVNHVSGYDNVNVSPAASVESWTTVDANILFDIGERLSGPLAKGLTLSVGVANLRNTDPPVVENNLSEIHFDGTNANAVGRLVTLSFTKQW